MNVNYVFDIGNVVLYFDPLTFLRSLWKDATRAERLFGIVFASPEWRMLDEGTITAAEAAEWLCHRHPGEAEHIRLCMKHWLRCLTPKWEVVALLQEMKAQGCPLYFMSNMSREGRDYILATYPFMSLFDGGWFSCDYQLSKPDYRAYRSFLQINSLSAAECLFTDDLRENVQAAEGAGMRAAVFTTAERYRDLLIL